MTAAKAEPVAAPSPAKRAKGTPSLQTTITPPHPTPAGVRTWQGDSVDLPAYMGPVDAFFFNAVFGNVHSQREALLRACLLLKPGGHIVVSHPLGRAWQAQLAAEQPQVGPGRRQNSAGGNEGGGGPRAGARWGKLRGGGRAAGRAAAGGALLGLHPLAGWHRASRVAGPRPPPPPPIVLL